MFENSKLARRWPQLFEWGKLLGKTGGVQAVIQATGFVCGIFILRMLSTEQYALYTLANTMLGTMTVLADGGISAGVMSEGGKQWKDRKELGAILATGMHMRQQFAVGSLVVSVPILYYLLQQQEGSVWWGSLILILALAPVFMAQLSASLLQIVPRLHQNISELLRITLGINVIRLIVTLPIIVFFPFAWLAILAAGAAQVWGNLKLRDLSYKKSDWKTDPDPTYRSKIMVVVKRILPGSIYYCLSGQITVWLIAIFSSTENVAQIGALSRLAMLLTLVRLITEMLVVPRYARLPAIRQKVIGRFFQVLALMTLLCTGIVLAVYLFPQLFLWILGSKYSDLEQEVVLLAAGSCLGLISGVGHMMSSSRGIVPQPFLFIGATVIGQALLLIFVVDYTSLVGVLWFSIYSGLLNIGYRIVDFLYQTYRKIDWSDSATSPADNAT